MMSQGVGKKTSEQNPRVGSRGAREPTEPFPEPSTSAGTSGGYIKESTSQQQGGDREKPTTEQAASLPEQRQDVEEGTSPTDQVAPCPRIEAKHKSGRPIQVYANFFRLIVNNPRLVVYCYHVTIEPEFPRPLIRPVWNKFASTMFPHCTTAFDGSKTAYSRGPVVEGDCCEAQVSMINPTDGLERVFRVSIREVKTVDFSVFANYSERVRDVVQSQTSLEEQRTALEVIMRNWATNAFVGHYRLFFPRTAGEPEAIQWSQRLELRHGFFQMLFLGSMPYVNLDVSHRAFYREVGVLEVFQSFRYGRTGEINYEKANGFLRTAKVLYYRPHDARTVTYKVNKLVSDALRISFQRHDGTTMTVADYFAFEKKSPLTYPNFPLLCAGPSRDPTFLPAELCTLAPDQMYEGALDGEETKRVMAPFFSTAASRRRNITELHSTELFDNAITKEFELTVAKTMEKVSARVLDPPEMRGRTRITVRNGGWSAQGLLEPKRMGRWCVVNLDHRVTMNRIMIFEDMIITEGTKLGMEVKYPARRSIHEDPDRESIKRVFSQLKDMDIVFVVIPSGKTVYSRVKTICDTEEGVLTQCVKEKALHQSERAMACAVETLLLKVNCKLGGENFCLDESSTPECLRGCVMMVGVDVAHPRVGSKTPVVAAVATSYDPRALKYEVTARVQGGEIIHEMQEIMEAHLDRFRAARDRFPERVIVFRDGVSEAQKPKLIEIELKALKKACSGRGHPKITVVVVLKRHHTRIFPTSLADEEGKKLNVPVGTCVDTGIVHPNEMDFVLVSHSSRTGTARPTKYRLIYDDNQFTDEQLQRLTYYLCHLSSRSKTSMSLPCPTHNARLVAARTRLYLEEMNLTFEDDPRRIQEAIESRISSTNPMFFL